jgi:protein SCO1/2
MSLRPLLAIILGLVAATLALWLLPKLSPPAPSASQAAAAIGGPFHLVDQTGRAVDESILKGRWSAVYFGYTYCPDVCPTTLQMLAQAQAALGDRAKDFRVVFVTVDPARDTPAQLKDYLSNAGFPAGAIGLTGSAQQVAQAAAAYRVYIQKAGGGSSYTVNHSSVIYLMNPQGQFAAPISAGITPDQARDEILRAMNG